MKKTGIKTMIVIVLAATVLAGQAFAQPGGGGRGRGGGQGWERGMTGGPRMGANPESVRPDNPRGPRGQYCPHCQRPIQNIRDRQGKGQAMQGRGSRGFQGRGSAMQGRGGRGFQGRGPAMQGRGGRGFQSRGSAMQGRGGRGFQGRGPRPQMWRMNGRRGQFRPEGTGRPGAGMQPRRFESRDMGRPMQNRGEGWAPCMGPGRRQGMGPGWGPGPQPERAPEINAPKPPMVENQPEKPQDE